MKKLCIFVILFLMCCSDSRDSNTFYTDSEKLSQMKSPVVIKAVYNGDTWNFPRAVLVGADGKIIIISDNVFKNSKVGDIIK